MAISVSISHCKLTLEHDGVNPIPLHELLREFDKVLIGHLLIRYGTKAKVAEMLLTNRTTIVEKCRRYGFPLQARTR